MKEPEKIPEKKAPANPPILPADAMPIKKSYAYATTGQTVFYEHEGQCFGATGFYIGPKIAE